MDNPFSGAPRSYREVLLERLSFGAERRIPFSLLRHMHVRATQDQILGDLLVEIEGTILGRKVRSQEMPDEVVSRVIETRDYIAFASWWDHAKFTFRTRFPKAGQRLTVKTRAVPVSHIHETIRRVTNTYHVCPHLEQDPQRVHTRFVVLDEE